MVGYRQIKRKIRRSDRLMGQVRSFGFIHDDSVRYAFFTIAPENRTVGDLAIDLAEVIQDIQDAYGVSWTNNDDSQQIINESTGQPLYKIETGFKGISVIPKVNKIGIYDAEAVLRAYWEHIRT